ncbi:MAG: TolC family protein [Flammeovirgaceae bacterium]
MKSTTTITHGMNSSRCYALKKRQLIRLAFMVSILFSILHPTLAQKTINLPDVITLAKEQSIASLQAATEKENGYWTWRTFQSNYKPQLSLDGILPDFTRSFSAITQPNGSIEFQPISNNNASATVSLSQTLSATGGKLFVSSQLQRFDDFDRNLTRYNGNPVFIGLEQPLFSFNALKWDKKIEPLRYKESQQAYVEELEWIAVQAVELYFDLLLAQVNVQISETNLANNDTIHAIGEEKYKVGQLSKNELLQLKLAVLNAQKSLATAKQDLATANLQLRAFAGMQSDAQYVLNIPSETIALSVNSELALKEALTNRQAAIAFERRKREAERDVAIAKGENGVNISLIATMGFSNRAEQISEVYQKPQDQQSVFMQLSVPLMDWGRSKSRKQRALANKKLVEYAVQQDQLNFEQTIRTQIGLYETYESQLEITKMADQLAQERYQIAKERYLLGNLSITNLNIALQEKDQAKRDYIQALRNYWYAFYNLRRLTLYDFERLETISTD